MIYKRLVKYAWRYRTRLLEIIILLGIEVIILTIKNDILYRKAKQNHNKFVNFDLKFKIQI